MSTEVTLSSLQPLADKIAIISGSSSGIGAAIARELAARGATVVINYPFTSEQTLAQAVLDSLPGGPGNSIIVEADLASIEGPKKLAAAVSSKFGKVDFLINNVGRSVLCDISTAPDAEVEQIWDRVINLNGRGTLLLTRAVLPLFSPTGSRIVNIGSSTSRDPDPDMSIYAGSKGMVESFTRCWARDFPRKYGCTVNTVAPGPTATEAFLNAPAHLQERVAANYHRVPVAPRLGEPREIAWVVAELCDERASWINGLYIPVSGGYTIN